MKKRIAQRSVFIFIALLVVYVPFAFSENNPSDFAHISSTESVALRKEPSLDALILGEYFSGTYVDIIEQIEGWTMIRIPCSNEESQLFGYVQSEFLSIGEDISFRNPIAAIISDDNTNVPFRDMPNGPPVGYCVDGTRVAILGEIDGEWCHVKFNNIVGFLPLKNVVETGEYCTDYYNDLPLIGYGIYQYSNDAWAENPYIDVDGFLNTVLYPHSKDNSVYNRQSGTLTSEGIVGIVSITEDAAQLTFSSCYGFGPRDYLHEFLFDEMFHDTAVSISAGAYDVGIDIQSGIYTVDVANGNKATLEVIMPNLVSSARYEILGPAAYTIYIPEASRVVVDFASLTSVTHNSLAKYDDTPISGTMRLLVGLQIMLDREDFYVLMPIDGCDNGYYRISTLLTDIGMLSQEEMISISPGEIVSLNLRSGEFLEFIDCVLEKDISNG